MAHQAEEIQRLIKARTASYQSAFENLDIAAVRAWHSKDIVFNDVALDEYNMNATKSQSLLAEAFNAMQSLKVVESQATGSAEFTVWEMLLEVVYGIDEPRMGIEKGKVAKIRGVSILSWQWEGSGEWNGDLSDEGIRGWKIVREHDYMVTLKDGARGGTVEIFGPRKR